MYVVQDVEMNHETAERTDVNVCIVSGTRNVFLPDFSEDCVACLCDASSACNLTIGCFAGLCGPFLIGRQYWLDAGAPVLPGATWQSKNGKLSRMKIKLH